MSADRAVSGGAEAEAASSVKPSAPLSPGLVEASSSGGGVWSRVGGAERSSFEIEASSAGDGGEALVEESDAESAGGSVGRSSATVGEGHMVVRNKVTASLLNRFECTLSRVIADDPFFESQGKPRLVCSFLLKPVGMWLSKRKNERSARLPYFFRLRTGSYEQCRRRSKLDARESTTSSSSGVR